MKTTWFVLALALVGCSKKDDKGSGAAPAGPSCETSINKAIDAMIAKSKQDAPPQMTEIANKLRSILTTHCKANTWPAPVIACFEAATDQPAIRACRSQLPPEQAEKIKNEIMQAMTGGGGMGAGGAPPHGGGAAAPVTPPPAGSGN